MPMDAFVGGFSGVKNTSKTSERHQERESSAHTSAARHADDVQHQCIVGLMGRISRVLRRVGKEIGERGYGKSLDWVAHVCC